MRFLCGWAFFAWKGRLLLPSHQHKQNRKTCPIEKKITYSHRPFKPWRCARVEESIFIHDPLRLNSFRRRTGIKDQSFLDSYPPRPTRVYDRLVRSGRLPVTRRRRSVRPRSFRVLPLSRGEEVPLIFSKQSLVCTKENRSVLSVQKERRRQLLKRVKSEQTW